MKRARSSRCMRSEARHPRPGRSTARAAPGSRPRGPAPSRAACGNPCALDLDGAELPQVLGDELRVEQREAAVDQPRAQVDQRHLAGVARGGEHALAEEGAVAAPRRRGRRPAARPSRSRPCGNSRCRTGRGRAPRILRLIQVVRRPGREAAQPSMHALEVAVDPDLEDALADGACQALGARAPGRDAGCRAAAARSSRAPGRRRSRPWERCRTCRPSAAPAA